jgi:FkbM family methyltransferase
METSLGRKAWVALKMAVDAVRDTYTFGPSILLRALQPRDAIGAVMVKTRLGPLHIRPADTDMEAIREVFVKKDYSIAHFPQAGRVAQAYADLLARGTTPIIIDAGANVGAASMWFARLYPAAKIFAIEPDPRNAALCRKNCAPYPNITVIEAAIGATAGLVSVAGADNQSWGVRTQRSETANVPVMTVDHIVAKAAGPAHIFMIKIDIEGFEQDLFATNTDWLDMPIVMMIELHDWMLPGEYSSSSVLKAVARQKFELINLHSNLVFIR